MLRHINPRGLTKMTEHTKPFVLQHKHLHPNNSSKEQRLGSKYATIAFVKEPNTGITLATGMSRCNKTDEINKKYGAVLARERALENALQLFT